MKTTTIFSCRNLLHIQMKIIFLLSPSNISPLNKPSKKKGIKSLYLLTQTALFLRTNIDHSLRSFILICDHSFNIERQIIIITAFAVNLFLKVLAIIIIIIAITTILIIINIMLKTLISFLAKMKMMMTISSFFYHQFNLLVDDGYDGYNHAIKARLFHSTMMMLHFILTKPDQNKPNQHKRECLLKS